MIQLEKMTPYSSVLDRNMPYTKVWLGLIFFRNKLLVKLFFLLLFLLPFGSIQFVSVRL